MGASDILNSPTGRRELRLDTENEILYDIFLPGKKMHQMHLKWGFV